jgi:hypothetical protein
LDFQPARKPPHSRKHPKIKLLLDYTYLAMNTRRASLVLILVVIVVSVPAISANVRARAALGNSQESSTAPVLHGKKLVMKDGSFQLVRSYQVEGDRVRYFSIDRSEWEEIPASEVDWAATKKAQVEEAKEDAALTTKIESDEAEAKIAPLDVDASLEVLPGVFLPPGDGFFILDGHAIFPLSQSPASTKNSKRHTIERLIVPIPVIPSQTSVDLPGRHAKFRIINPTPEFYFRTSDDVEPQVELIQAHVKGDKRHIENIDSLFGQRSNNGKTVLLQTWQVAKGIYRFTLGQPLAPGEYALAEFSPKEGINLLLWDFGVDAAPKKSTERK